MSAGTIISKSFDVIESCKTLGQLEVAKTYSNLAISSIMTNVNYNTMIYGRKVLDELIISKAKELSLAN